MSGKRIYILASIGIATGFVTGIFGGGGGMILVPLLTLLAEFDEDSIFPTSISVILAICIFSLFLMDSWWTVTLQQITPYLAGSLMGGIIAGKLGSRIPVVWLHRILGVLILWGGIRYLCQTTR